MKLEPPTSALHSADNRISTPYLSKNSNSDAHSAYRFWQYFWWHSATLCDLWIYMWAQPRTPYESWSKCFQQPTGECSICVGIPAPSSNRIPDRASTMDPYKCLSVLSCHPSPSILYAVVSTDISVIPILVGPLVLPQTLLRWLYTHNVQCVNIINSTRKLIGRPRDYKLLSQDLTPRWWWCCETGHKRLWMMWIIW